jgi:DNA invertase Pin-like site-specific DNA recombinase
VRYQITKFKRRLRVLIYARYSKDEQNPRSIDDQVAYCKRFLAALGFTDVEIDVLSDEGISGEKLFRPGINQVRAGIDSHRYDLIVVEDCSRLFRNVRGCMELVGDAVEAGIRVFCINDEVDTADEEHWEEKLYEAASHHQRSNKFTSKRIIRALEALWQMGAAIGLLKPGYLRTAKHPAADGEQEEGPFFDSIDPDQAPTIATAFERVAARESLGSVANWLTAIKFPKASNARSPVWTPKNLIDLIRRTDYRGWQTYRNKTSKRKRGSGNRQSRRNDPGQIWTRSMPDLRIVSDWLWHAANRAIDERGSGSKVPQGDEHPLAGIPRDSRGPLSKVFVCGRCSEKMYVDGRNEGGYRCADARRNECWNKASALRDLTHRAIGRAIIDQLQSLGDKVNGLAQRAAALLDDHGQCEARRVELVEQERELETSLKNLNDAIEKEEEPPESIVQRISQREAELAKLEGELAGLIAQDERFAAPTPQEIVERIDELIGLFQIMDRSARDELELLVGEIKAVPYQQFDTNKIVLRARFELRLGALLPGRTRAVLASLYKDPLAKEFERVEMLVDLFEPSTGPRHGLAALELKEQQHLGMTAIGKTLVITKRRADLATQYGAKLRAAGLVDPFIELTAPPPSASRWRSRRDQGQSPDRRAG